MVGWPEVGLKGLPKGWEKIGSGPFLIHQGPSNFFHFLIAFPKISSNFMPKLPNLGAGVKVSSKLSQQLWTWKVYCLEDVGLAMELSSKSKIEVYETLNDPWFVKDVGLNHHFWGNNEKNSFSHCFQYFMIDYHNRIFGDILHNFGHKTKNCAPFFCKLFNTAI